MQSTSLLGGGKIDRVMGKLLYQVATRYEGSDANRDMLVEYVCGGKLTNEPQLSGLLLQRSPVPVWSPVCVCVCVCVCMCVHAIQMDYLLF